jgi:hypothetical protein
MMRNWKWLGLELVLLGALTVPVSAGQSNLDGPQPDGNRDAVVLKQLDALKSSIDALTKSIEKLNNASVATGLQINKAQSDIDGLKSQLAQMQQDSIAGMQQRIGQLQREVDELRRASGGPRVSGYGPTSPPPATGRVRIVNSYVMPETVIVNGRAYNVNPGGVALSEPIPVGTFTYEVVGVQGLRDRLLAANETFTITIHP